LVRFISPEVGSLQLNIKIRNISFPVKFEVCGELVAIYNLFVLIFFFYHRHSWWLAEEILTVHL